VYENVRARDSKYVRLKINKINYDRKDSNQGFIYVLKQEPRGQ
jgi:hypothetical protein